MINLNNYMPYCTAGLIVNFLNVHILLWYQWFYCFIVLLFCIKPCNISYYKETFLL